MILAPGKMFGDNLITPARAAYHYDLLFRLGAVLGMLTTEARAQLHARTIRFVPKPDRDAHFYPYGIMNDPSIADPFLDAESPDLRRNVREFREDHAH